MFNPLSIEHPYDELTYLDNLPGYDTSEGTIEQLDIVKEIQQSGNYYWQGLVIPRGISTIVGGDTVEGSVQLVAGTYITSIQVYNDYTTNPQGFKLNLYDKGSKANFFYGDYQLDRLVGSNMQQLIGASTTITPPGMNLDRPFGPGYMKSAIVITNPGVIGFEIVNQGTTCMIQVLLCLAVPVKPQSIGQVIVERGRRA